MPVKGQIRGEFNSFVKGLITEASPINFPENASAAEENFELNRDGSRTRRLGMDIEPSGVYRNTGIPSASIANAGISTFRWVEVAGSPELEFEVIQFNRRLDFYDLNKERLSSNGFLGSVTISEFPDQVRFSFASVEGSLVVVAGVDNFAVVTYEDESFEYSLDRITIRDLFGVEETIASYEEDMSYRGDLDIRHYYNLQNQSWGIPRRAKVTYSYTTTEWKQVPNPNWNPSDPDSPQTIWQMVPVTKTGTREQFADPIESYRQNYQFAPSNGESVWIGMQFTPGQFNGNTMQDPYEQMFTKLFKESWGSEVKTARGYYVIDALRRGQSRVTQMQKNKDKYPEINIDPLTGKPIFSSFNLPSDYTTGGATCVAEFAGRMFFSGFKGSVVDGDKRSPNYTNFVFFSMLVKNKQDLGRCYQDGDPTGRETTDVLDTDGGFLRISEAKEIHSLVNIGTKLVVIASNGVWSIDGGSDYGFSATNYRVTKISTFGGLSTSSVALENNRVFYWAEDGIYTIGSNEFGDLAAASVTIDTIQSLYDSIPSIAKTTATSVYDPTTKRVRWLYNPSGILVGGEETTELILDTALGAFMVNKIKNLANNAITVIAPFRTTPYVTGSMEELIFAGTEQVFSGSEPVVGIRRSMISGIQSIKYLVVRDGPNGIEYSFSLYHNTSFTDWETVDGVGADAKAFCLTGDTILSDSAIKKQIPYLVMHFERTEDSVDINFVPNNQSSCLFRCQWNFSNEPNSKKWTPLMQAYRYRKPLLATSPLSDYSNGFKVVTSKNKVRGIGRAFSLYFETEPKKDCRILGWNLTITGDEKT